ncbi:putative metabolite transport protein GIT1 [Cyphellophora attinorum]|uniref:Putative metabolite transport protein GIT1 n=1 Tax=Cyphellophora attinorum TaxID=1664694 RepID=A0A0N1HHJ7_9EURO|nr:putative metabolite transport protein GIT1 [Phialophora attinorum]KPI46020.1 putative metabolite transport protein GIT1 [Phialophora attinorum]
MSESSEPLLGASSDNSPPDMPTAADTHALGANSLEIVDGKHVLDTRDSNDIPEDDPTAPSRRVSSRRQRLSDLFTILCAGCALISDGYANSLMTLINVVLRQEYAREYTSDVSTRVSNALLVGEIIGQITIGLTCDYLGRKTAIILTSSMIIVGLIICTAAHGVTIGGMFWMLTIGRGVTGYGTGGECKSSLSMIGRTMTPPSFPVPNKKHLISILPTNTTSSTIDPASSTSASESANAYALKSRGTIFILVTNLPLTFGVPLASSIFLIVLSAAGSTHPSTIWRVCFGIGIIFPVSIFYWRVKMLNSALYRRGAIRKQVTPYALVLRYYWKSLIGTCGAWFLFDFVTIPNAVFSGGIIANIVPKGDIKGTAEWQLLLGALGLPGVIIGAFCVGLLSRKTIMLIGFGGYLVFGLIIGLLYDRISKITPLFVVLYGLLLTMGNFGPGNMVGLVASESYATAVRGTCYGISAAMGKTGAAVGTQVFLPIQNNLGLKWTFIIAAIVGVVGMVVTWFFVPNLTGDDLAIEDERFRGYLIEKGWKGLMGEDDLKGRVDDVVGIGDGGFQFERRDT